MLSDILGLEFGYDDDDGLGGALSSLCFFDFLCFLAGSDLADFLVDFNLEPSDDDEDEPAELDLAEDEDRRDDDDDDEDDDEDEPDDEPLERDVDDDRDEAPDERLGRGEDDRDDERADVDECSDDEDDDDRCRVTNFDFDLPPFDFDSFRLCLLPVISLFAEIS